ncbi:hypothetical protein FRC06_004662 [Ceratobasidium sp. 370]|nr:hypothetical protein FRC06_004662 [Ceratobasidium sp. 370]
MNPAGTNARLNDPANPADPAGPAGPDPFGLAALLRPPPLNYQELADKLVDPVAQAVANQITNQITNQVATRVANQVATQVANRMNVQAAPQAGPAQAPHPSKKTREEGGAIGLGVGGVKDIGSDRQPGPDDVDADNEAPWVIDFDAGPEDPVNQEVVDRWIREVLRHPDMATLVNEGKITADKSSHAYVRKLLIHSFDTARSNIKINQDEMGALHKRQEISKDNNSESNPVPDLSGMRNTITTTAYKAMRKGTDYEMLTPGWRSDEMWGTRRKVRVTIIKSTRRDGMDDIPDNLPRCMLNDEAWNNIMDEAKRATVVQNPPG